MGHRSGDGLERTVNKELGGPGFENRLSDLSKSFESHWTVSAD